MKTIINFLRRYGYGMFLGGALVELGASSREWRFYAILIPMVMLVEWRANYENQKT